MTIRLPSFDEILFIVKSGWYDLLGTDFNQLKYSAVDLAVKIGAVTAILILLKLAWVLLCRISGWHKYSRMDSGHTASRDNGKGFLAGFFLTLPKIALLASLTAILFAIASPFITVLKEEKKYIKTRTRVEAQDVSGSMGFRDEQSGKSRGEINMNARLKFLEMRRGKNDRVALWAFSDDPYPIQEDFIIDDDLIYLKAYDAPWEIGGWDPDKWTEEEWRKYSMPRSRFLWVAGQGGTQLSKTLKTIIRLFDEDEKKQKKTPYFKNAGRSVLITTDAMVSDFYSIRADFEELSKRKIIPYIIWIDGVSEEEQDPDQPVYYQPELLKEVVSRGGKFFSASDEKAIENAYREIDKLEAVTVEVERKVFKIHVFHKFVFLAIICLIIVIPTGLLTELLSYP